MGLEMTSLPQILLLVFAISGACSAQWTWANHGKPPVYTGLADMKSGSNSKLFGVGNGNLQERYWTGSAWTWANHGQPGGLWSGERLAAKPCVMKDGRVYIVSNKGRLFERYWTGTAWAWGIHGKASGTQSIRTTGCTCTISGGVSRVFVVGTNFKLYEHYWSSTSNQWVWRYHGSPPGTNLALADIDSCIDPACTEARVYVVGANGNLYYRKITNANPGVPSWVAQGKPCSPNTVRSVSVSAEGVFITTEQNYIFERTSTSWEYYGRPSGSIDRSASLSKAVRVDNCSKLPGTQRYLFVYSWDPSNKTRGRLFSLRITGSYSGSFSYHGNIGKRYYIDEPTLFMNHQCPKLFVVRSSGEVYERYVQ